MSLSKRIIFSSLLLLLFSLSLEQHGFAQKSGKDKRAQAAPVLWRDPGQISSRNLRFGPGSPELAPVAPFTFVEEDKSGESPKFKVTDAKGVLWSVKLGDEAQAETVSTRILWAVGFFAEEAYYFDQVRVENLPRLSRGREYVSGNGIVRGARFEPKRKQMKRGKTWGWHKNPFEETRELSGLKVLMILLNNYDAREANNRVFYTDTPDGGVEAHYYVSDIGATLGRAGGLGGKRTKNSLEDFLSTRFVRGIDDGVVEFDYDTRPRGLGHFSVLHPFYYRGQVKKEKVMRGISVEHARWVGSLLSQLTDEQLRDAFRAADFDVATMEAYVRTLRERINQIARL